MDSRGRSGPQACLLESIYPVQAIAGCACRLCETTGTWWHMPINTNAGAKCTLLAALPVLAIIGGQVCGARVPGRHLSVHQGPDSAHSSNAVHAPSAASLDQPA
ncbi:hypothetical protein CVIRNUC_007884 [Coccomyxa viridis]|uniref:Uncharacterized protein n=1 Tax=Coccomyxa viridis TaxID=1274662 RepID=A0AAV1IEK5_9CHLO|nr:hypothetical protein CVIRNUC_007884 [Coccomyxa viridis]